MRERYEDLRREFVSLKDATRITSEKNAQLRQQNTKYRGEKWRLSAQVEKCEKEIARLNSLHDTLLRDAKNAQEYKRRMEDAFGKIEWMLLHFPVARWFYVRHFAQ